MIGNPPKTLEEALDYLLDQLSEEDQALIAACETGNSMVSQFHHGFGTWVRNSLGLWEGNDELVEDLKQYHPDKEFNCKGDDASSVILEKLWVKIRGDNE